MRMECDDEIWVNAFGFWIYHRSENAQLRGMMEIEGFNLKPDSRNMRKKEEKKKHLPSIHFFFSLLFFFPPNITVKPILLALQCPPIIPLGRGIPVRTPSFAPHAPILAPPNSHSALWLLNLGQKILHYKNYN